MQKARVSIFYISSPRAMAYFLYIFEKNFNDNILWQDYL